MKINKLLESKKLKEGITNTEPDVNFQGKSSHTITKDKKWEVDVDEKGNILARTRHGKPSYFKGHINDKVNDFPSTDEDNIILAAREQYRLKFGNKEVKEDYSHFEFTSGANPYIAKDEKEKNHILKKYGNKVKEIKPGFYKVDDSEKDLFRVDESVQMTNDELVDLLEKSRYTSFVVDEGDYIKIQGKWRTTTRRAHSDYIDIKVLLDKKLGNGNFDLVYEENTSRDGGNEFSCKLRLKVKQLKMDNLDEAFKPSDSGIQSVKCYNPYNYTIQELRVDNDNKTFERGNFTAGKPDKKTKNRQEYEDIVDTLKKLGYTEIKSDYRSMRNKSRKGTPTSVEEGYELSPRIDYNPNHLRDDEGKIMADRWYASKWPDDEVGIEQLKGITLDDALKDRSILGHCDTQVRERVYAQLDRYIPLSVDSPMYKEKKESKSIKEARRKASDPKQIEKAEKSMFDSLMNGSSNTEWMIQDAKMIYGLSYNEAVKAFENAHNKYMIMSGELDESKESEESELITQYINNGEFDKLEKVKNGTNVVWKLKDNNLKESIEVETIGDYITDHYDFDDIDDKYSCINSIKDSFKDEKTISKEELEQFIGSHNGRDKVNEWYTGEPDPTGEIEAEMRQHAYLKSNAFQEDKQYVIDLANECKAAGHPIEDYNEFKKICKDAGVYGHKLLWNIYMDTIDGKDITNEGYFSDDDVEDDIAHANLYGGDTMYCRDCGTKKKWDDGYSYCPKCNDELNENTLKVGDNVYVTTCKKNGKVKEINGEHITVETDNGKDPIRVDTYYKNEVKKLDEAHYGGAFDIADDQYFTRDDLNDFAEEVLNHINETFKTSFDVSSCYIDNGILELCVTNDEYGDYIYSEKIDMRKIKEPWHLKRAYAFEFASQLINDITQSNDGLVESFDDDVDDLSYYYSEEDIIDALNDVWEEVASKSVADSDGFMTDYTMYRNINTGEYVFVFGDKDIYRPEDGYFDWECETEEEAKEWFDNYNGFDEDEFEDFEESYEVDKVFSAACNNRMDYVKRGFAKGKIDPNARFNRFNSDHSYIMGALRNGNKDMVKLLQDNGGTILDDEQNEYNRLMNEDVEGESPILHKKGDGSYLVASDGGGYTAFNKSDVCMGHITANNEQEAKNKFNSNQFDKDTDK